MKLTLTDIALRLVTPLIALASLTACNGLIYDDEGDCDPYYKVKFVYDTNLKFTDAFAAEVSEVTLYVVDPATGNIVWKIGPYFDQTPELRKLGWIIGQHHAHMIPRGLPGEGHILVFDNGGWGGYDVPNPGSPTGVKAALRDHSRVLEIDPVAMKIVWQYTPTEAGFLAPMDCNRFYSPFISGMQRLPNGNTLITEGSDGRVFEVTKDHELVWEFISPYWGQKLPMNMVYRAYRVPYEWVPQLGKQEETPIERIDVNAFRMPGAAALGDRDSEIAIEGCAPYEGDNALCVASVDDPEDQ